MQADQIVRGFPLALRADAEVVAARLPDPLHTLEDRSQIVLLAGEEIAIAPRVYYPELPGRAVNDLSVVQELIVACIYSRHHDGYVRQSACEKILPSAEPWVVPYVVQLLGEYVLQISSVIIERLSAQSAFTWPAYRNFVHDNPAFVELTEQRAISYWSCYYRGAYSRSDYPALVALRMLRDGAIA